MVLVRQRKWGLKDKKVGPMKPTRLVFWNRINRFSFNKMLVAALGSFALLLTAVPSNADSFGSGGNQFTLSFVPIGNAGNANDTSNGSPGIGGVSYDYDMAFTAVSETMMEDAATLSGFNLGTGSWTANQPMTNMSWYQAAAFVNWLNTSQGYAAAYDLTYDGNTPIGITSWTGANVWVLGGTDYFRNANAHYFLPSENEWYKAAFYDPNKGGTGVGGYWTYATGSDTPPTPVLSGTDPGTAVYNQTNPQTAIGPAPVDQAGGLSPYGTIGQNGNVWEWTKTDYSDPTNSTDGPRVCRGGDYDDNISSLPSSIRYGNGQPWQGMQTFGFRVASVAAVPEPDSTLLLGMGFLGAALIWRKRKAS